MIKFDTCTENQKWLKTKSRNSHKNTIDEEKNSKTNELIRSYKPPNLNPKAESENTNFEPRNSLRNYSEKKKKTKLKNTDENSNSSKPESHMEWWPPPRNLGSLTPSKWNVSNESEL